MMLLTDKVSRLLSPPAEISEGRLQLFLYIKAVAKLLEWATGRILARAVGYIYVEAYGTDREDQIFGVRFVIRYRA